jgi:hypothetical protein
MDLDQALPQLRDLCKSRRLVPFVGAGLSLRFKLKSWDDLMRLLAKDLRWDPEVFLASGDAMQLAEYYQKVRGKTALLRLIRREFALTNKQVARLRAHRALTKLNAPIIYTTNYDDAIERTFRLHKKPHAVISGIGDIACADDAATQVVKYHGTFDAAQSLVLSESSYLDRMDFEGALDIKLRADLLGRSLLFLGSSFRDIDVRFLLYKLHKLRKRRSATREREAIAFLVTFNDSKVQRAVLKEWSVETIELDPGDRDRAVDTLLEALL